MNCCDSVTKKKRQHGLLDEYPQSTYLVFSKTKEIKLQELRQNFANRIRTVTSEGSAITVSDLHSVPVVEI